MDYNKAIQLLERLQDPDYYQIDGEAFDAIQMAVEALEKQIPMKPNLEKNFDGWKFYTCPNCKIIRHDFDSYCDNCGQAIDRSEL